MTATLPPRSALAELPHIDTKAACGTGLYDPELWHSVDPEEIDQAKSICLIRCPVMERCRAWALASEQEYGVWGALSAKDREAILKQSSPEEAPESAPAPPKSQQPKTARVTCRTCGRIIGLDLKGRITRHMDWTHTYTWCVGSLQIPTEAQA